MMSNIDDECEKIRSVNKRALKRVVFEMQIALDMLASQSSSIDMKVDAFNRLRTIVDKLDTHCVSMPDFVKIFK